MAIDDIRKMMAVGVPAETAKVIDEVVSASGASVAWDDVTGKPATFPATVPVSTATALATGRTITVNFAAAAATPTFDGTANVTASLARGAAVANCTVAADGTSAGTQLNALLAALRTAGVIAT